MEKPYRNQWDANPVKPRDESTKSYNEHLEDAHKRGQIDAATFKQYKIKLKPQTLATIFHRFQALGKVGQGRELLIINFSFMKNKTYKCAMCNEVYENGWSEEEAEKECVENFGEEMAHGDDRAIICDDCYQKIKPEDHIEEMERAKAEFFNQEK